MVTMSLLFVKLGRKEGKEIHGSSAITPQTAAVPAEEHGKCCLTLAEALIVHVTVRGHDTHGVQGIHSFRHLSTHREEGNRNEHS